MGRTHHSEYRARNESRLVVDRLLMLNMRVGIGDDDDLSGAHTRPSHPRTERQAHPATRVLADQEKGLGDRVDYKQRSPLALGPGLESAKDGEGLGARLVGGVESGGAHEHCFRPTLLKLSGLEEGSAGDQAGAVGSEHLRKERPEDEISRDLVCV